MCRLPTCVGDPAAAGRGRAGLTLLELLLVVLILGLVAATLAGGLAGRTRPPPLAASEQRVTEALRRMRTVAERDGALVIALEERAIIARRGGVVVAEVAAPPAVTWRWTVPGGADIGTMTIDGRGRSADLVHIALAQGPDAGRRAWTILGGTGQWVADRDPGP
jgi:prepilin-type N-terminal cleavage/methylation domain-containing protein